jgi:hypothetical protein
MESGIEKSSGDLICLNMSLKYFKPSQIGGTFHSWFHCNVLCELGLPPRDSILKRDHQGQRGVMGDCGSMGECLVNSGSSYRLVLKRGGGSRGGSRTGLAISRDRRGMSDSTASWSDDRVIIASTVECITRDAFFGSTSLREILFASDCHLKQIDGFRECTSLCRIEIPSSVKIITQYGFYECPSLSEIHFTSNCHLRQFGGFQGCTSLCRIEIPSSVEIMTDNCFYECTSLSEVHFASDCHLRELGGFQGCRSLCRIEIPSSVQVLSRRSFSRCHSLRMIVFGPGSQIRESSGLRDCTPFIIYDASFLRGMRRRVHLQQLKDRTIKGSGKDLK